MKKAFLMILMAIAAIFVTSCGGDEAKQYKGTYKGTYTFVKEDGRTKDGSVLIVVNAAKENSLLFWGVINLDNTSSGVYESTSEEVAVIANVLSLVGLNIGDNETLKNIHMKATFKGNHLELSISYGVEVLGIATIDVRVINFVGDKS
ncbi:MAG: hypothetical protein LBV46_03990 [Bacteroidales bacterium]|jgi:hypothetical protein|nr:hypothetical protein [Bacteroidales bacterium]